MHIGMIGFGGIAQAHLLGWRTRSKTKPVQLTIYDIDPARRQVARDLDPTDTLPITVVDSLEDLLARVDVVDICTPSDTHSDLVRISARAGKQVLSEKPLALTVDDAADAARVCRDAGVSLHVGHVVRFFGEYAVAHQAVLAGTIGTPAVLRFRRASAQPRSNDWMQLEERSGGVVLDLMIHDIDQARWFAGDVVRVMGRSARPGRGGIDTIALAVLTHADGALTHLTGSWAMAGGFETSFEIAGTDGILFYDSTDHATLRADRPELLSSAGLLPLTIGDSPFATEIDELADAAGGGPPARVTPADAIAAVSVANAIRESMRTGAPVEPAPVPDDLIPAAADAGARAAATGTWM
jgi:myo-inositol 2-dehydrogenase/D-chiro-inositol 1-dehydrogenase